MKKLKPTHLVAAALAAIPAAMLPSVSSGQVIFSDDFNSAASAANYNVYATSTSGSTPSSDATFAYDYSALGITAAPNTLDGTTLGLRLRVDNLGNSASVTVGAISVITKTMVLPTTYTISFDLWANYIGGTSLAVSGSNGSTAPGVGVGTSGSGLQSPNGNDGILFDAFHDGGGGSAGDFRVYADNTRLTPNGNPGTFAAGNLTTSAGHADAYYAFLPSHTAPGAQTTLSPSTQGGSTPAGIIGFQWTQWTITQDGTSMTWSINGHVIATVANSSFTRGGNQISFDSIDSGLSGNSTANGQLLNGDIIDNVRVVATPEPSSIALMALGAAGFLVRRFKK